MVFPETVRAARTEVLKHLIPISESDALTATVRGQYEGYQEALRLPGSQTETFFSLFAYVNSKRWKGVPFMLTSGKGLNEDRVDIRIYFKDNDPASFLPKQYLTQERNQLTFTIKPEEKISILFWVKIPGFETKIEPKRLTFTYHDAGEMVVIPDAYERVLYDCFVGDHTLFASTQEIEAQWNFIEGILRAWKNTPLHIYKKGSKPEDIAQMAQVASAAR